jgi:alkanesulfonate monooxygenase SsuD/methylene tetrahydromethanopterin reductase-like flavin-dependent oxidoreductase (luciferase family)
MRQGMFMMPVHPPGRTFWSTLEEDGEKSVLADTLGFDELWLGEHFSATTEPIPSPMMFFAGLLPRTKTSRSAPPSSTCPIIIPRSWPLRPRSSIT